MESPNIIQTERQLDWRYDQDADVLYISTGASHPALGVDIGEGVIARYDEARGEVIGITIIGLRHKMARELSSTTND